VQLAVWAARVLALNFLFVLVVDEDGPVYAATLTVSVAVFAAASTISVLRYRSVEIDLVLRRAFIVAGVAGASLIVFLAIFLVAELAVGSSLGAIGAGLTVALLAVPLRSGVGRRVDRLLYGHRDPASAIAQLSNELDLVDEPAAALPGLARAVSEALGATAVVIEPAPALRLPSGGQGRELAEPILERQIGHRGQPLGRLLVGARAPVSSTPPTISSSSRSSCGRSHRRSMRSGSRSSCSTRARASSRRARRSVGESGESCTTGSALHSRVSR
jgi:hypothetical protein